MEDPGLSSLKKLKRVSSAGKVMASVYSDNQGIIVEYYLEEGHMINCACYAEELRQLCQEIVKKRRGKLAQGVLLLQEYTSPSLPSCYGCCD